MADLDNYAYPLAYHLRDPGLVSVWCTKQHSEQSLVRIEPAREISPPSIDVLVARTTASASTVTYKEQIDATVAFASELPPGPVRLELAFVVGPRQELAEPLETDNRLTRPTPGTYRPVPPLASARRQDHRTGHAPDR